MIELRTPGSFGGSSAYRLLGANPAHASLRFKKLEGEDDIYSVRIGLICSARIGLGYRALDVMRKERVVWYWIGNPADFDRLV